MQVQYMHYVKIEDSIRPHWDVPKPRDEDLGDLIDLPTLVYDTKAYYRKKEEVVEEEKDSDDEKSIVSVYMCIQIGFRRECIH
jgi:hypothetical protein